MGQSSRAFQEWFESHEQELYEEFAEANPELWADFIESEHVNSMSASDDEIYERMRDDKDMNSFDEKQHDKAKPRGNVE